MQYTTWVEGARDDVELFYQDFKDTFVCNTQLCAWIHGVASGCFIRISKILLYAIHNSCAFLLVYTLLFYQDFKDTFVCNTQQAEKAYKRSTGCFIRISKILLYAIHNTALGRSRRAPLFYQDFKDTFVCNTQLQATTWNQRERCFIRISKILLYAIHNTSSMGWRFRWVVLSGFQWTILLQKYRKNRKYANLQEIILIFQKKHYLCTNKFEGYTQ